MIPTYDFGYLILSSHTPIGKTKVVGVNGERHAQNLPLGSPRKQLRNFSVVPKYLNTATLSNGVLLWRTGQTGA